MLLMLLLWDAFMLQSHAEMRAATYPLSSAECGDDEGWRRGDDD